MPSSPIATDAIFQVAVPVPGLGLLTYRAAGRGSPPIGARVTVPLGRRTVTGIVVNHHASLPAGTTLRDVTAVVDETAFLPQAVVDLAVWVGEYYAAGPGEALALALPPVLRQGRATAFRTTRVAELTATSDTLPRGPKQREALAKLRERAEGLTLAEFVRAGVSTATVRSLVAHGLVRFREKVIERDPFAARNGEEAGHWTLEPVQRLPPTLTAEQAGAFRHLEEAAAARLFRTVLLHGVTGSGKTELYLRLAERVIASGRRVLVLVPEIALTPATSGLFRGRFGSRVAIQHSALAAGERYDQWQRIRHGDVDVVVGTRSAVFTPLEKLGLIVVDEEHDGSYKQEELPRYHGRDVAVVRGRMEQALVVLGSATPSLESASNARSGRYDLVTLTKRVLNRPLAAVEIVDMRREFAARGPDITLSAPLTAAIDDRLTRHEQVVVLLNRRGFATVIFCRQCGASMECPHCSVALTYHRAARRVRCHYCNYASAVPRKCGACGGEYLEQTGFGTERIEADLREAFPRARIARVDRDTIRKKGAIARTLREVAAGAIDILIGTQMIAKGHDFPSVTLVGVISADVGLGLADFRASERTFQLLTQVVGRAGRGQTPGEAIVQTLYPTHYSIRAAADQDYAAFFEREMEFRTKLQYPPVVGLINVVVRGATLDRALADAGDLVKRVRVHHPHGRVLGPAPAPLAKVRDEHRAQFFIKGTHRKLMREAITAALDARAELKRRTIVDVDPLSVI